MNSLFLSLQARLIFAFVLVTAVALAVAAGVFVAATRDDQERRELDRVAAASPAVVNEYFAAAVSDPRAFNARRFAAEASARYEVRILLIDARDVISADSSGNLVGKPLGTPHAGTILLSEAGEAYTAFETTNGVGGDLVFIESALPFSGISAGSGPFSQSLPEGRLVLAVPKTTITRAWVDLLPTLGVAGAVAFPVAILCAILFARSIARPVHQLTLASRQLGSGSFDIDVRSGRMDEIGQLSEAFSNMAVRVGVTQSQMRQLIANVSHDLNTPLTAILGFSHALSTGHGGSPAEVRRMGAVIEEEAQRLSTRMDDLLYLSELDAGHAIVDWQDVDLSKLVASVLARVPGPTDTRGEHPSLATALVVKADPAKLERILENLISNAAKHAPQGGNIRVRTFRNAAGHGVFEIANAAEGLSTDEVPRLFERFYRGDRSRSATAGSGLGLAIARDLAGLMGGSLDGRLTDGQELVFTLSLPAPVVALLG